MKSESERTDRWHDTTEMWQSNLFLFENLQFKPKEEERKKAKENTVDFICLLLVFKLC